MLERSQNSVKSPNLIEFPTSFKLREVDALDALDVLRAVLLLPKTTTFGEWSSDVDSLERACYQTV